jgi:hypothetical protein
MEFGERTFTGLADASGCASCVNDVGVCHDLFLCLYESVWW